MAKDMQGHRLKPGDLVLVTLQNPSVFGEIIEVRSTQISMSSDGKTMPPSIVLAVRIPTDQTTDFTIGCYKLHTEKVMTQ